MASEVFNPSEDASISPYTPDQPTLYGQEPPDNTDNDINLSETLTDPYSIAVAKAKSIASSDIIYRSFYDECPFPLVAVDKDTKRIVVWNRAAELVFLFNRNEAIGSELSLIIPAEMMTMAAHDIKVDEFSNSDRSRSAMGSSRILEAKKSTGDTIVVKVTTFKIDSAGINLIGAALIDISKEQALSEEIKKTSERLRATNAEMVNKNKALAANNETLFAAKQQAEFRMERARSQDRIANRLMGAIIGVIVFTLILSVFTRIPETILSFVKDSSLLLLGILSGAIGGIFGNKEEKGGSTFNNNLRGVQGGQVRPYTPVNPTEVLRGRTGASPVAGPDQCDSIDAAYPEDQYY